MIQITDMSLRKHYLHKDAIARVSQAGPNGSGIGAYVKMFDGQTIEARESAEEISRRIEEGRK